VPTIRAWRRTCRSSRRYDGRDSGVSHAASSTDPRPSSDRGPCRRASGGPTGIVACRGPGPGAEPVGAAGGTTAAIAVFHTPHHQLIHPGGGLTVVVDLPRLCPLPPPCVERAPVGVSLLTKIKDHAIELVCLCPGLREQAHRHKPDDGPGLEVHIPSPVCA